MSSTEQPIRADELEGLFARFASAASTPWALAVSGGGDSTALMVLLADWLRATGQAAAQHTVLTVDHGLRTQSAAEARVVAAQAEGLGFRHATLVWAGPRPQTGIQAAARAARYRLMGEHMRTRGVALLLTAHTRDDQAETLLMRLARGSGLDGLSAMAPLAPLGDAFAPGCEIARPLLDVPKARLLATLQARGVGWIEDPSNQAPAFERARLRALRAQRDALGLTDAMLALSAARLLRVRRTLDRIAERFCDASAGAVGVDPCGYITIDRARLREAGEDIARRVVGRAVAAAGGSDQPVALAKLESIVAALCAAGPPVPARWTLARAMLTATDQTVAIERELGRAPLPRLTLAPDTLAPDTLAPDTKALWDGRFWVGVGTNPAGSSVEVRALGEEALGELRRLGAVATLAPSRVVALVPSLWRGGSLVAVPSLQYWTTREAREQLQADFVGIGKFYSGSRGLDGLEEADLC